MSTSYIMSFLLLVVAIFSSATAYDTGSRNPDILAAIEEMQKANYFTFVMLVNMAPPDLFQGNVTFLMPNDRALSKTAMIRDNTVVDFLLHHSIPSPLLIDHLEHFPTGSLIPTSSPGFVLRINNDGRHRFFLNNVRIISPNICTQGSSIRCHGIDGVVQATSIMPQPAPSACTNNRTSPPAQAGTPPAASPSSSSPQESPVPAPAPPPGATDPPRSSSAKVCNARHVELAVTLFMLLVVKLFIFVK